MAVILALLAGPLGRWAMWGALVMALAAGGLWGVHAWDNSVRAAVMADYATAAKRQADADAEAGRAALAAQLARAVAERTAFQKLRSEIDALPVTNGCVHSPAIDRVLHGLRSEAGRSSDGDP